ncbi:protein of unknown function [Taphrina deformans PYCC 5710]|uniref:Uncharacterized protein n=1 Tax=Taphrina deformans (strain PYCC 5710 / ATCC 11124 / CBS 356.35 / IMI 108563 / JCM 9778 / NBRC 8474) TaxID=1097556 RepID=R4X9B9_TAPDE|nr:protein of unknown function [Taphrina deformans PYCC 5710]|eukprot:CCG80787.1 protein of unknown function [Taphrina deformans PYCC 5710]
MPKAKGSVTRPTKATADPVGKPSRTIANSKASHLYTDDNPETTLHGTGFKDGATAQRTIELVSKRSLTYQFQTINTMLHRARGHPHKSANMMDAMVILQDWVDSYRPRKASLRTFKLISRDTVERYLKRAEEHNEAQEGTSETIDVEFARMYTSLAPKKRLANTLVDSTRPGEQDWEVRRYEALCALVPEDHEMEGELWLEMGSGKEPSVLHLKWIMWGYSPVKKL